MVIYMAPQPPEYRASPALGLKACAYCLERLPQDAYRNHLLIAHSDLLFQCDECDSYIDIKDFILHMRLHVDQYTANNKQEELKKTEEHKLKKTEEEEKLKKTEGPLKRTKEEQTKNEDMDEIENTKTDSKPVKYTTLNIKRASTDKDKPAQKNIKTSKYQAPAAGEDLNEFSDHGDTEYVFDPLPESVFEAIEDSQDVQRLDDCNDVEPARAYTPGVMDEGDDKHSGSGDGSQENKTGNKREARPCPFCSKVYTAKSSYFYHLKYAHRRSREHECQVCGRSFGTRGSLAQHMNTHSDNCRYECKVCGKKFRSNPSLYIHEQSHGAPKTYTCDQCQLAFRWRTHLERHRKRHAAEKTHECPTCGRGFTIKCDLLRHIRTHSAGEFKCDKCQVKFAQNRYLKVHMAKKHSIASNRSDAQETTK